MVTSAGEGSCQEKKSALPSTPSLSAARDARLSPSGGEISASIWRISLPSSTDWQRATTICGFSPISSDWSSRRRSISPISHQTAVRYQALRLLIHPHRILRVQSGEKAARSSVEGEQRMQGKAIADIVTEWKASLQREFLPQAISNPAICPKLPRPTRLRAFRATQ